MFNHCTYYRSDYVQLLEHFYMFTCTFNNTVIAKEENIKYTHNRAIKKNQCDKNLFQLSIIINYNRIVTKSNSSHISGI